MRKFTQKALSLLTLACLGSQAQAVGLGNIEVNSKLNQPLNARIKLMSIPRQDMQNLGNVKVRLASAEAFKRAGLERPVVLSNLRFSVEGSGDTTADIRISSSQPIKEPFVNFLLEVDWPNGRILREYTVLLDPPLYKAESTAPVTTPKTAVSEEGEAPVKSKKSITSRPSTAPLPDGEASVTGETHTVKKGESLAGIANKMRSGTGVSQKDMMQAIFDANPEAFVNRKINKLRSGVVLQTPAVGGNPTDQNIELDTTVATNKAQWNEYRDQAAEAPETAPITTAPAPKKAPPRPKPAAIKRPLEISGTSEEGTGSGLKGEIGELRQKIQEATEENKRIQQENKALKEDIAATKQLVDSMKMQIDALIKVQNDILARLEQQAKNGQTAGATVAAAVAKIEPPKTDLKSESNKTPETVVKTDVKPEIKPDAAKNGDGWGDKPKIDVKPDIQKTEVKSEGWGDKPKVDTTQASDSTKKLEESKKPEEKKDTPKTDAAKPADKSAESDKPKSTPVANKTPQPPEEVSILDSALIMASDVGNMADNAVSAVPGGWWTVGGGLGAPLLGGLGWGAYRKRRKSNDVVEDEDDELLQAGKDEFSDRELENLDEGFDDLESETSSFIASDEILDEVDVYVEYERYDQALETLNHALEQRPDHEPYLIKRLEIDAVTGNTKVFEEHAQALHQVSGEHSENWQKAQSLWSGISHKPLNITESSPKDKDSGGIGLGTVAAIGLGAAGLAAAGLAVAGAFGDKGDAESDKSSDDFNSLEEDGGELDFSSLDVSDAGDMNFNLSSTEETDTQTLDMDSLDLGEESDISNADSMNFDQDFNLGEETTSFEDMASSSDEEMNFLLNQEEHHDLNLHEEASPDSLSLDSHAHEEMDLSMNLDEEMNLDDFNLGESLEETPVAKPLETSSSTQEEDMSFLLDDSDLDLGSLEEEPTTELKSSEPKKSTETEFSLGDDFLLDDSSLDLGTLEEPAVEASLEAEKPAEAEFSLGDDFLLDDSALDLGSLDETPPAISVEETHSAGAEEMLNEHFIDDVALEDFGSDLTGEITSEDEFALDDSFNMDLSSESTDELNLDTLSEETLQDESEDDGFNIDLSNESTDELNLDTLSEETRQDELEDDSFNIDLSNESPDELNLDTLNEETSPEEANEFALDESFNMDLSNESTDELNLDTSEENPPEETDEFALDESFNMDLSSESNLDGLSEENPPEETDEFALDDSFNMDLSSESNLDSLSEENPPEETDEFTLDDSFNLDMGSLEEENTTLLEMPTDSNPEDEFKLDDDFSDFNLSLNDEPSSHDDLDLSLSADEQALLGDDFNLDLNNDFNLEMDDDIEGKFDLVQTYLESDDIASAQSTLEEIVKLGSPEQQARAQEVLKELGL